MTRKQTTKKQGRPSAYSLEIAEEICARIAAGESLRAICQTEGMPSDATVSGWAVDDVDGFYGRYARAKQMRCLRYADELIEIADDGVNDTYVDNNGKIKIDHDHINRSALRIDTRKWLMVKYLPRVFGDKIDLTHSGGVSIYERILSAKAKEVGRA